MTFRKKKPKKRIKNENSFIIGYNVEENNLIFYSLFSIILI